MHTFPHDAPRVIWPSDAPNCGLEVAIDLGVVDAREKPKVVKAWIKALPNMPLRCLNFSSRVSQPLFEAMCQMPGLAQLVRDVLNEGGCESVAGVEPKALHEALPRPSSSTSASGR